MGGSELTWRPYGESGIASLVVGTNWSVERESVVYALGLGSALLLLHVGFGINDAG